MDCDFDQSLGDCIAELKSVRDERDLLADALRKIDADLEGRNFLESSSLRDTARTALAAADGEGV